MFKTIKTDSYIEHKYQQLKATFMDTHSSTDDIRQQATALLAHLHTHVYEGLMTLRTARKQMALQEKAVENVRAALDTITREDSYASQLQDNTEKRKKITEKFNERRAALDRLYKEEIAALYNDENVVMVHKALDTVYVSQRALRQYYWKLSQAEQALYKTAIETELATASKSNKRRACSVLT